MYSCCGRVLRTVNATAEYEFEEETRVTAEDIYSLNLLAVENAHHSINDATQKDRFYCVGNTPIRYQLNGYDIGNLEGIRLEKYLLSLLLHFFRKKL